MCTVLELLCVLFSVTALNFPFNTRCSNEQLKNVLLLFGFQDKCPIEFVLSRTFVLFQSKWKWAPDHTRHFPNILPNIFQVWALLYFQMFPSKTFPKIHQTHNPKTFSKIHQTHNQWHLNSIWKWEVHCVIPWNLPEKSEMKTWQKIVYRQKIYTSSSMKNKDLHSDTHWYNDRQVTTNQQVKTIISINIIVITKQIQNLIIQHWAGLVSIKKTFCPTLLKKTVVCYSLCLTANCLHTHTHTYTHMYRHTNTHTHTHTLWVNQCTKTSIGPNQGNTRTRSWTKKHCANIVWGKEVFRGLLLFDQLGSTNIMNKSKFSDSYLTTKTSTSCKHTQIYITCIACATVPLLPMSLLWWSS